MAIELRATQTFHAVTILLFYILKNPSTKALYFPKTDYNTSFQDFILSGASVTSTS
jgi:hypothetical protein